MYNSFTDYTNDYLKKKKKKADTDVEAQSFTEYTKAALDNDVAPVRSRTEEEEKKWYQKFLQSGRFDDGYQRGDVTLGILGTASDIATGVTEGVLGLAEGLTDLAQYGVAGVADLAGADDFADKVKKNASKNVISGGFKSFREETGLKDDSFLGDTGYGVAQGLGQVGAVILTGGMAGSTLGATALTTGMMGASSMGSGMGEAYSGGATDEEAWKYGALKGAIDAGTELIFGGLGKGFKAIGVSKGLTSVDDVLAKKLSSKISSKFWANATEYGVKAGAEGVEELLAGFGNIAAKKLTYMSEEEWSQLREDEGLLEQFAMGVIVSGIAQGGDFYKSTKSGRDFVTDLTDNETKVVEAEVENRISAREEKGETLTKKQKNEIYETVVEDLKKGYIHTDTIGSIFGGDTYKAYKDAIAEDEAAIKELESMLEGDELEEAIDDILKNSKRHGLKTQLSEEVQKQLVRQNGKKTQTDDYLIESYNEEARGKQYFEADLSQYDEKQRATIQKAIDSGILNNQRRTHELVDMIAKISADKGVSFDFADNKKIQSSGFAVNGKTVNAYVIDGNITLNVQNGKYMETVVGHEITHVLEGTELYDTLQEMAFEYAKGKSTKNGKFENEYQERLYNARQTYKNVKGYEGAEGFKAIKREVVSDLVGDYLFTDPNFVNHLSRKHRNIFQKIYDEIKYLCKIATAGSNEARQLEKLKRAFEEAYRGDSKAKGEVKSEDIAEADAKYSISVTDKETIDFLENQEHITTYKAMQLIDGKLYPPMAAKVKGEDGKYRLNNPSELGKWQQATEDPTNIKKVKNGVGYYTLNKGNGKSIDAAYNPYEHSSNLVLNDQFEEAYNRDNIVTVECEIPVSEMTSGYKAEYAKDGTGVMDWKSGVVAGKIKDNKRKVYLSRYLKPVRILSDAETAAKFKDVVGDVPVPFNVVTPSLLAELEKAGVNIDYDGSPMYKSIQKRKAAKAEAKYSLSAEQSDKDYLDAVNRGDTETAQKMVDEVAKRAGYDSPKLYHGTNRGGFTIFDDTKNDLAQKGFFFTTSADVAKSYFKGSSGTLYTEYVRIKKPLVVEGHRRDWNNLKFDIGDDAKSYKAVQRKDGWWEIHTVEGRVNIERQTAWATEDDAIQAYKNAPYVHPTKTVLNTTRDIVRYAYNKGVYDGVIIRDTVDMGNVNAKRKISTLYIPFDSNQIKSADTVTYDDNGNVIPLSQRFNTKNDDIRYSLSDSEGNKLTKEQAEYFKDSKAVDRNGNLLKVYHTTNNDFTVFDKSKKGEATGDTNTYLGFFFADDAEYMQNFPEFENGKTEAYYLNMTNPIDMTDISKEAFIDIVEVLGGDVDEAAEIYDQELSDEKDRAMLRGDNNTSLLLSRLMESASGEYFSYYDFIDELKPHYDELMSKGYDGVVNYLDEMLGAKEYIVLDSNQAKLTSNLKPTADADIRYSLSEDSQGRELSSEQREFFKDSKIVDDNGKLLVMYHGTKKGGFTVFENKNRKSTEGFYFTNDKEYSNIFEGIKPETGEYYDVVQEGIDEGYFSPETYEVYLNVKNPFVLTKDQQDIIEDIGYWENIYKPVKAAGYDGVMMEDMSQVFVFNSNQIKRVDNANPTSDADIRYSLSDPQTDRDYLDAVKRGDTEAAQKIVEDVATEAGYTVRAYHGTRRGDRVGNVFLPERATSGPMAFFTDTREIAEGYAKSKQDTSMAYDPDFDQYETQFRIKTKYQDMPLYKAWGFLPFDARNRITKKAGQLRENWDGDYELILDPDTNEANGGFQWQLKESRGNAIQALTEQWLNSGTLFKEESRFLDVLEMAGVTEEFKKIGMDSLYFKDPDARHEKVYDTYLRITNPFDTANADESFADGLESWYEEQDQAQYERESVGADLWDKNSIGAYDFAERVRSDIENGTSHAWTSIPDAVTDYLKYLGYDGIKDMGGKGGGIGHTVWIPFTSEQVKSAEPITYDDNGNVIPLSERFNPNKVDIRYSLSWEGEAPVTRGRFFSEDLLYKAPMQENIAPVTEDVVENATATEESVSKVENVEDVAPVREDVAKTTEEQPITTVKEKLSTKLSNSQTELAKNQELRKQASDSYGEKIESLKLEYDAKKNKDTKVANNILRRIERLQRLKADVDAEYAKRINDIESKISKTEADLQKDYTKADNLERAYVRIDNQLEQDKIDLAKEFEQKKATMEEMLKDKGAYISNRATELYNEISNLKKGVRASKELGYLLDHGFSWNEIKSTLLKVKRWSNETINPDSVAESTIREMLNEEYNGKLYDLDDIDTEYQERVAQLEQEAVKKKAEARKSEQMIKRSELHRKKMDEVKAKFTEKGFDFDEVLKKAKNLSTFATVDNTPQRVMEKSLGYKEGQILADETVNKVAQNETEGIKWLNSFTDRKNGLLAKISNQYNIKPGSKESAAAQMYAEGFYVDENNDLIKYGDEELAKDFPDSKVQENIKGLAKDKRIRQIYDETLKAINESRTRNAYPEIPRLDNYFLHFRAMEDTFSRLGLPFNPNDIRAKDLPTDLNGVTADLKPGQPYFASAMHRKGQRTSFDLLGGLERYLSSAKNQIYHIDDIQTLRALRNYIADTFGQANGLEGLDTLSEEEAEERIKQVYNSHLSTFAKFLNEEANIIAGKTALIDRGLEGIIGRRGITFLNNVNKQVGANMIGFNVSSSLTNVLAGVQAIAKTNKLSCIKALAQTTSSKIGSLFGKTDSFVENNPTIIRRKGADRFYRTPFQKVADAGYVLMSAVDNVTTEFIVRAKYDELIKKGMSEEQATIEVDKWTSRLMADRSLGQMPQLYNSKMLGLVTKFQLEVRNQLDSQFYDTIKEAKASTEDIKDGTERNAKTAAKVTATFFELAVLQHLFGKAFESVAGYNPAFDIIDVLIKTLGLDDDEDDEDTALDNVEEGFLALLEDLPYTSTFTGGRIPISSALPIEQFVKGKDEYGNEKSRLETLGEIAPYYVLPTGYGQAKKTIQGLSMFDEDHPVSGSYTDSGNLRFPVEDTLGNRVQAGLFGQWASENARDYFDNERAPLKEKQIQEYIDVDMPIRDYWEYREGLSGLDTLEEKANYINGLDVPIRTKNILINNIANRKEDIDMSDYDDYGSFEEFDFAEKYPNKYAFLKDNGVSYIKYALNKETKEAYNWAYENPEMYTVSKAIASDVVKYRAYVKDLNDIKADRDENGKTISGSRKEKVIDYINNLNADYGEKIIMFKSVYNADDTYNYDIIEYLNSRTDISYEEMVTILKELGFTVHSDGTVTW